MMANKTISKRKIAERLGMTKHTVKIYIDQFHSLQTTLSFLSFITLFFCICSIGKDFTFSTV